MAIAVSEIERVYRSEYRRFLRVALAILHDRERARDAVQETFARAVRARREIRELEPWLWRTVTNLCLDVRRRAEAEPVCLSTQAGPAEEWSHVRAAVAELPERQRLALFLRHYADLDYDQIAAALGVRRGTVAATLHAARERLRKTLEEVLA